MKKLQLVAAILALLVYGCSEQMNPVEPGQTSGNEANSTAADVIAPTNTAIGIASPDALPIEFISVSEAIVASVGGTVRLQGTYVYSGGAKTGDHVDGDSVNYDVSLTIPAGALPYDATISISIDKSTFADDGTVTFGPCGLVFNTPVPLSLHATNIVFVKKNHEIRFYYLHNGIMEPMPASYGSAVKKSGSLTVDASAQVPHFSRYAFGR